MPVPEDVLAYYGLGLEAGRLAQGEGALEFERTKELVQRFLGQRSRIADVGGAFGHYAEWLVEAGHRVDLVDPTPEHIEAARERAGEPPRFAVHRADARELPFEDGEFDAVLLFGPLYHLPERVDRLAALREAARICCPRGLIFAVAISRFAPLLGVVAKGAIVDERIFENVQSELRTGRRVDPERRVSPFPDAYFHLPEELAEEVRAAGLEVEDVYAVEGLGRFLPDLEAHWRDEAMRERILAIARTSETDAHVIACSAHLMAVARTPDA
jgi:SAM-dependent methyltransferase